MSDEQTTVEDPTVEEATPALRGLDRRQQGIVAGTALVLLVGTVLFVAARNTDRNTPSVSATGSSPTTTPAFPGRITGLFALRQEMGYSDRVGGPCQGRGGYSDITSATQVTVSDAAGVLKAVGNLGPGTWTGLGAGQFRCDFEFVVTDVPRLDVYQLEVGRRGKIAYTHEQLRSETWAVQVSLGD